LAIAVSAAREIGNVAMLDVQHQLQRLLRAGDGETAAIPVMFGK